MKRSTILTVLLALAASLAPGAAAAQNKAGSSGGRDGNRARGLFINKKADAMQVVILKVDGNSAAPVDPSRPFKSGDQIKVAFQSNFEGYVYIVNVTPGGKKCVIFPYNDVTNAISAGKRYELPSGADTIRFDEETGTEVLQVVMSRQPIPLFDAAVKVQGGCLGESASSAAAELASARQDDKPNDKPGGKGGIAGERSADLLSSHGIRARNIILAPGRDKDQEGSYVAISTAEGDGKLKDKEVAIFEIRLRHN